MLFEQSTQIHHPCLVNWIRVICHYQTEIDLICQIRHDQRMDEPPKIKSLLWVGSSKKDLKAFPAEVRSAFGFALYQAQLGRKLDFIHLTAL